MSMDGTKLLFEGFLEKRKDTMKIRWVTYWFRLQNTTLFFYTKKNGSAAHLRGHYYIYTVQSVREVQKVDSKRFMFEIIMTNGKRKLLAAETAALRHEWVGHLWQAMSLSTSGLSDYRSTQDSLSLKMYEQRERTNSTAPISSHSDRVMDSLPARPLSAPAPAGYNYHEPMSIASPISQPEELDSEEPTYQNTFQVCGFRHHSVNSLNSQWSSGFNNEQQQGDYDVLPVRKQICEIAASPEMDRDEVYDFPLSYRKAAEHPDRTESIYDVPSSLVRTISDNSLDSSLEEQRGDGVYRRI